jgi:hypothetical protein
MVSKRYVRLLILPHDDNEARIGLQGATSVSRACAFGIMHDSADPLGHFAFMHI